MKKLTFQIRKGTKNLILGLSLLGIMGAAAICGKDAKKAVSYALIVPMVAQLKKKGEWDALPDNMKTFIELQDEAHKNFIQAEQLSEKMTEFAKASLEKGMLTETEKADFKSLVDGYKSVILDLQKIKDSGLKNEKGQNPIKALMDEKDGFYQKFLKEKKAFDQVLDLKTADTADIDDHTIGFRVPGIGQLPVRKPFMMDIFPVVTTNLEFIKYIDQESITRNAKNVAGIATSIHTTAVTWKERNIQITKVRDFIYLNIDMLSDYDFVLGELQKLVGSSVTLKVDNGLLLDDGVYPNLHSVDEKASEFDHSNTLGGTIEAWTGKVEKANIFDVAVAMASQIVALGKENNYMPDTILWNTLDKYKSMLVKDDNGQYLLPPFVVKVGNNEWTIDNMKVRTNPNVPANTMYVFDSTKGTIYQNKGIGLEMAYNNKDQFEYEVATMKAYTRLNLLIRNVDANAFMVCSDIAAAITAITKGASS